MFTTALFVDAGAASADAFGCTFGSSSGNVRTCISIIGNGTGDGLFVDEMTASAEVLDATRTLRCASTARPRPYRAALPFEVVHPGSTITVQWFPDRNVPAGTYCARTWRKTPTARTP